LNSRGTGLDALLALEGPVAWIGIGNADHGDDGFGVRLAESLAAAGCPRAFVAGTAPERGVERAIESGCAHAVFLDATTFDGAPGSAIVLDAAQLEVRYPQVSTHAIALGTLARLLDARGVRAWLVGVKPLAMRPGTGLSEPVREALERLKDLIVGAPRGGAPGR
jgi:hydrogenase maturation protease